MKRKRFLSQNGKFVTKDVELPEILEKYSVTRLKTVKSLSQFS